jgi:hypothetical protein
MRDAGRQALPDDPGMLDSSATTLRLIAGWAGVALGVLNLAMGVVSAAYLAFHLMLVVTGVVLLGWAQVPRRPGRIALPVGVAVAVAGLVLSAVPATSDICCLREFPTRHGFPFTVLARSAGGGWHFDGVPIGADLIFWICTGLLVGTLVAMVQPAPPARPSTHAEQRATRAGVPRDENVGGLP